MAKKKQGLKDKERRAYALRMAIQLGCSGAHKMPDGSWAPCSSHEEMMRLSDAAESNDWMGQNTIGALRERDRKARAHKGKSLVGLNGRRPRRDQWGRWENLEKSGAINLRNSLFSVVSGKSVVPAAAPRDTDPDVFMDPDSARVRSRQLGCIGISRRVSRSGRTIWMPCTNMSDYARLSRTTALGRRGSDAMQARRIREIVQSELRKGPKKR